MSSPPVSVKEAQHQKIAQPQKRRSRRGLALLLFVLLAVGVATIWQVLLNRQPDVPIAGRPLSSTQTHLHTVVMSSQPGVVYLGTHFGLFTSTDNGHTWPQQQGSLNTMMITSLAVSPTDPDLLAALGVPNGGTGGKMGIYTSSDAGQHWKFTLPANLPSSTYPYTIVSAPGAGGHFYVFFSFAGWFETHDLGQHWQPITSGALTSIQSPSLLIDPQNPDHLLMGGDQGLFETNNDGQHWQQITTVQGAVVSLTATQARPGQQRIILCATDQGLYRQQGQELFTLFTTLHTSSTPNRVLFSADGTALYALAGGDLWFSSNQGATWTHAWHFTRSDLVSLAINPHNPRELLAGFFWPGLVLVSTDAGISWQTLTG